MNLLLKKIRDGFISILPIYLIIIIINFTNYLELSLIELVTFSICSILAAVGIGFFNVGADLAMTPMGKISGSGLTKQGKASILLIIAFLLGFFVTIAEPNLQVLGNQVKSLISPWVLILAIALGVGIFLVVAILRIIFRLNLAKLLLFLYFVAFSLVILVIYKGNGNLLALAMDSGGVTTGPITVPFMMAICIGISSVISRKSDKEMSFGLIGLSSIGSIIIVLGISLFINGNSSDFVIGDYELKQNFLMVILENILTSLKDVSLSLLLISLFFIICNFLFFHLPKRKLYSLGIGVLYTLVGLVLFLGAVNAGFMPLGYKIGESLAANKTIILGFSFILGALTVVAEPAIHVLNSQVEEITGGILRKRTMLIGLMIGVGISLMLSILRIIYHFDIMYYLIPGFGICFLLTFFIPKVYTAIAFDSGGVAAGALTSGFILPLAVGATVVLQGEGSVLTDSFGIVAMVALTPVLVIEFLGLIAIINNKRRIKKQVEKMISKKDEIIIRFEVR